jgi:hypothetical protein
VNPEPVFWKQHLDRVARVLARRREAIERRVETLRAQFPQAARFDEELRLLREADERFLTRCQEWSGELLVLARDALIEAAGHTDELGLRWDHRREAFELLTSNSSDPTPLRSGPQLILADAVDTLLSGTAEPVSYPIVFTHETTANHRAVAQALLYAAVALAAEELIAEGQLRRVQIQPDLPDSLPDPGTFGFVHEGELSRRVESFVDTDPDAHWCIWLETRGDDLSAARWVLRDLKGATLAVEIDPELRRLRLRHQSPSTIVRKRRTVFVDPTAARSVDCYFATAEDTEAALKGVLQSRIREGFRLVTNVEPPSE